MANKYQERLWLDVGPCITFFGDTPHEIGPGGTNAKLGTHGGVSFGLSHTERESFRDIQGGEPFDATVMGQASQVRVPVTGADLETLELLIPGAELSTGPAEKALLLKSPVGISQLDNAQLLTIKQVIAGVADTDIQKHAVAVKAFPLPEIDVVFGDDQKIFMVTFKIFRDPATGVLWTFGQDAAA